MRIGGNFYWGLNIPRLVKKQHNQSVVRINTAAKSHFFANNDSMDSLHWWHDRFDCKTKVDLRIFAEGDGKDFPSIPSLIGELAPAIKILTVNNTVSSIFASLDVLKRFWRFLGWLEQLGLTIPHSVMDIDYKVGQFFKDWLLFEQPVSQNSASATISWVASAINAARRCIEPGQNDIWWPNIPRIKGDLHADIDPDNIRKIGFALRSEMRCYKQAKIEGRKLLSKSIPDPRVSGWVNTKRKKTKEYPFRESEYENLLAQFAYATKDFCDRSIEDESLVFKRFLDSNEWSNPSYRYMAPSCFSDPTPMSRVSWFLPTFEEACINLCLFLQKSGWNSEVAFSMEVENCFIEYPDDNMASIWGYKGRAGKKKIITSSQMKPTWHPYQVLKYQIEVTKPLRDEVRIRLGKLLEKTVRTDEEDALRKRLQKMLKSPWLFYRLTHNGAETGRIGCLEDSISQLSKVLRKVCQKHGVSTEVKDVRKENGVRPLKLSDFRDGYAAYVFAKSGGNFFILQQALKHNNTSSLINYIRQNRHREEALSIAHKILNFTWRDIEKNKVVDPTLLFVAMNIKDIEEEDRRRLFEYRERTRVGMGCGRQGHKPKNIASKISQGKRCSIQRCILCDKGMIFEDSFQGLAERYGEILYIKSTTPVIEFEESDFQDEKANIEIAVDAYWGSRKTEFMIMAEDKLEQCSRGEVYVFDTTA
ncbi:hypothetical protein KFE96_05010 [Kordiimonas sp. SCSIO 12603]|uniref:hypothetical protein n=1 Tax=Kordiimonas sp. SCSIO 12603 TaxID=2829596 RepID=UPI002105FB58|nr:hypothetical protein [Kordiimonas sp. SCSIO 12603]UTW59666.1 hypothetical protein KFE96_05010 [Kordiimonas sp. SCSIO 12603]